MLLLCASSSLPESPVEALVKDLSNIEVFAFGGVGYAGQTSKGEIEFQGIASLPASVALTAFENLYATGNSQAKSYALFGIRKLNPARFKELLKSVHASREEVTVMRGCVISTESLRDVAGQIDAGKWDFSIHPMT
jgi:hypothetical protein